LYLNGSWLEIRSTFSQVLIIVTVLVAGWENIRLRGLIANMAKLKKKKDSFFKYYLGFKFVNNFLIMLKKSSQLFSLVFLCVFSFRNNSFSY
jgi:hypothetical protein